MVLVISGDEVNSRERIPNEIPRERRSSLRGGDRKFQRGGPRWPRSNASESEAGKLSEAETEAQVDLLASVAAVQCAHCQPFSA